MTAVILLLVACVGLGLAGERLGRAAYLYMGLLVLLYITYAYLSG